MSKHTPGPWAYSEHIDGDGESLGLEVIAHRDVVSRLPGVGLEDYANAQLIAAAPALLAAPQALVALQDKVDPEGLFHGLEAIRARRAIAASIGEAA